MLKEEEDWSPLKARIIWIVMPSVIGNWSSN
jgi:hypothetical protein